MCTSGDNSRRNLYSICAINTVPVLLLVTIENIVYNCCFFFVVLLHILTHDLLSVLI